MPGTSTDEIWSELTDVERTGLTSAACRVYGRALLATEHQYDVVVDESLVAACVPASVLAEYGTDKAKEAVPCIMAVRTAELDHHIKFAVMEEGIKQLVILGAGLDTRAWRLPWLTGVKVWEVDSGSVEPLKQKLLLGGNSSKLKASLACASRTFIKADLEQVALPAMLTAAGYDASKPTVFLVEGLIGYLSYNQGNVLFAQLHAAAAPGSFLIASAPPNLAMREGCAKHGVQTHHQVYEEPEQTEARLLAAGWTCRLISAADQCAKYQVEGMVSPLLICRRPHGPPPPAATTAAKTTAALLAAAPTSARAAAATPASVPAPTPVPAGNSAADAVWAGLTDVERTALQVSLYRLKGAELLKEGQRYDPRYDAALTDMCMPKARQDDLLSLGPPLGIPMMAIRTAEIDHQMLSAVNSEPQPRQVVILGAGLDPRAWRLAWPAGTSLFEVDTGSVEAMKSRVMGAAGFPLQAASRAHISFDLSQCSEGRLQAALSSAGYSPSLPSVWLCEGLIGYLTLDAGQALMQAAYDAAYEGSTLVMTAPPTAWMKKQAEEAGRKLHHVTIEEPKDLVKRLRSAGWSCHLNTGPALARKYGVDKYHQAQVVCRKGAQHGGRRSGMRRCSIM
mmetsp:Transcript_3511/g.7658  ORF Transcript_3511/g.7658 Transcript_3511/m.7658 type:complete len:622 (+) Transcript_3511:94-1959(+)